jgi:hypothetical protein
MIIRLWLYGNSAVGNVADENEFAVVRYAMAEQHQSTRTAPATAEPLCVYGGVLNSSR